MRRIKGAALLLAVGAASFALGRIKGILQYGGNIVVFTKNRFYTLSVMPFDATYTDTLEDLDATVTSIFDERMDSIEIEELNKKLFE